jgi:dipeptidyl-peptidase 4
MAAQPRSRLMAALIAALALAAANPLAQTTPPRTPLTIERITSQPSLTGTAPVRPVWSPDSARLAFLWNDKALPFRDVWIVAAGVGEPRQITDMATQFPYAERIDPDPNIALAQRVAARQRGGVSEVLWTPDGGSLILSYRGDLFRVKADGGGLERLPQPAGAKSSLEFSPDGRFLSFLKDGDLWFWHQSTSEMVQVTRIGQPAVGNVRGARYQRLDTEFSSYSWAPDSRHVALYFDDRSQVGKVLIPNYIGEHTTVSPLRRDFPGENDHVRAIGIYSVDQGALRMVELDQKTDRRINSYNWSPNGQHLLIDQNSENVVHRWIYVVSAEDATARELWHDSLQTRTTRLGTSDWLSDSSGIVFVADLDDRHRLYSLSLAGGRPTRLTTGEWSVLGGGFGGGPLTVSVPKREIFFTSTEKNPYERQVYRMSESGGRITQVTSLAGTHVPIVAPDGSRVALLHSSDVTPPELYIADAAGGTPERRVTHSPPEEFHQQPWIQPRYVTFKSHVDGATIHARLLEPPNLDQTKKYPVIIGPVYSNTVRNGWRGLYHTLQQYLAIEGEYIGLHVDVRGSSGYGREFRETAAPRLRRHRHRRHPQRGRVLEDPALGGFGPHRALGQQLRGPDDDDVAFQEARRVQGRSGGGPCDQRLARDHGRGARDGPSRRASARISKQLGNQLRRRSSGCAHDHPRHAG